MTDWVTISSSLATGVGTLVLAVATFSSVRSANRSARVAEESLLAGVRPVLIPSREDDPVQRVRFGDGQLLHVPGHGGAIVVGDGVIYLAMGLRNGGAGLAVIDGWRVKPRPRFGESPAANNEMPPLEQFHRQNIDLYIPAGDSGNWLGALRDPREPVYGVVRDAAAGESGVQIDILYGDHEGGQRTVVRMVLAPWPEDDENIASESRRVTALRYWNVDRADPRDGSPIS